MTARELRMRNNSGGVRVETGRERVALALVVRQCHREVEKEECNDVAVCQGRQRECGEVDQFLR